MSTRTTGTGPGTRTGARATAPPLRDAIHGGVPPLGPAIAFLRRLRQGIEGGPAAVPGAAAAALAMFPTEVREAIDRALQRAGGE